MAARRTMPDGNFFLATLQTEVPRFLSEIVHVLKEKAQLDVSQLVSDHVCWRTETLDEYQKLVNSLQGHGVELLIESEIGGRLIATFQLDEPIASLDTPHSVRVIEIPSPKASSPYPSGLEHVEFVIGGAGSPSTKSPWNDQYHQQAMNAFMRQCPQVQWNTKAQSKEINPDVSFKLKELPTFGSPSVKFHLMPLADVIAAEKQQSAQLS